MSGPRGLFAALLPWDDSQLLSIVVVVVTRNNCMYVVSLVVVLLLPGERMKHTRKKYVYIYVHAAVHTYITWTNKKASPKALLTTTQNSKMLMLQEYILHAASCYPDAVCLLCAHTYIPVQQKAGGAGINCTLNIHPGYSKVFIYLRWLKLFRNRSRSRFAPFFRFSPFFLVQNLFKTQNSKLPVHTGVFSHINNNVHTTHNTGTR